MNLKQILSFFFSLMFFSFAVVQYNDPDPWAWIIIYSVVGVIIGLAAFGKVYASIIYVIGLICVGWMVFLFPGMMQWIREEPADALLYGMSPDKMYIEESREFLGLFMVVAALGLVVWQHRRKEIR